MHFTIRLCIFVFITTTMFADGIQTEQSELNTNINDLTNFTKLSISVQFPDQIVHGTAPQQLQKVHGTAPQQLQTIEYGCPENVWRCKNHCRLLGQHGGWCDGFRNKNCNCHGAGKK
jgi:hypothetical protein